MCYGAETGDTKSVTGVNEAKVDKLSLPSRVIEMMINSLEVARALPSHKIALALDDDGGTR